MATIGRVVVEGQDVERALTQFKKALANDWRSIMHGAPTPTAPATPRPVPVAASRAGGPEFVCAGWPRKRSARSNGRIGSVSRPTRTSRASSRRLERGGEWRGSSP
jgi:hypothetical protein